MKLKLPSVATGFFNERNRWIYTSSQMGRKNVLPEDVHLPVKMHLQRLKLTDGGVYDSGGAYWGGPQTMWIAFTAFHVYSPGISGFEVIPNFQVYVRANNRGEAKQKVRREIPAAKFYR